METTKAAPEHYQAVLADLHRQKARIEEGIRVIEGLAGAPASATSEGSLSQRVLALLTSNSTHRFTMREIRERLGQPNFGTLRGVAASMVRKRQIVRRGRGVFQAR